ncbi:MAG: hypothetical protein JW904_09850 [Spirochaetales bacterium]|nr:hypothetical protein [Spirochaetales bacterium]
MIILCIGSSIAFGQDETPAESLPKSKSVTHALGDQAIAFGIGTLVPLFHILIDQGEMEAINLFPGIKSTIQFHTYLTNNIILGVSLDGGLAFTPNFNFYWYLPITGKIIYNFELGDIEIPVAFGLGVDLQKFLEGSRADLIIKPEVGFKYKIDPKFSFCVWTSYWFILQIANEDQADYLPGQSRLANFLDITIGLTYNF